MWHLSPCGARLRHDTIEPAAVIVLKVKSVTTIITGSSVYINPGRACTPRNAHTNSPHTKRDVNVFVYRGHRSHRWCHPRRASNFLCLQTLLLPSSRKYTQGSSPRSRRCVSPATFYPSGSRSESVILTPKSTNSIPSSSLKWRLLDLSQQSSLHESSCKSQSPRTHAAHLERSLLLPSKAT